MRCSTPGAEFLLRARFGCFLADEKAIKEIWGCKGASGTKMCLFCKNIVGRMDVPRGGYIAHHQWATPDMFDLHTDESVEEMVMLLDAARERGTRAEMARLSQVLGLTFDTESLLWDEELRHIVRPISGTYWDWMHILLSSGGVVQYELNNFLLEVRRSGIPLRDIDMFCANIVWPKAYQRLSREFFQKRIDTGDDPLGNHIHAFASEVLDASNAIALFIDMVLAPAGALADHCKCFHYMVVILHILTYGSRDDLAPHLGQLTNAIALHHELFIRLYPRCVKPKLDYLWHLPQCMRWWGVNLNCFSAERTHKRVTSIAKHVFRQVETHRNWNP